MKSYDVLIRDGSQEYPLLFGRNGGIRLGNALKEPASPGSVGSIVIQTLHHGFGHRVAIDPATYWDADWSTSEVACDASVPGRVISGGSLSFQGLASLNLSGPISDRPGTSIFWENTVLVIFDRVLARFSPDGVFQGVYLLPPGERFTGSVVEWRGQLILGAEDDLGFSVAPVIVTPSFTYSRPTNADLYHSWAASTRIALFWVKNRGGKTANAPELRWTDRTDIDFGSLTIDIYGPFFLEVPSRRVEGMGAVGVYPIFTTMREEFWGLDRDEVFFPLSQQGPGQESRFGHRLLPWMNGLIAFSTRRLVYLSVNPLMIADIHPVVHQSAGPSAGSLDEGMRIRAVTVHRDEVWVLVSYGTYVDPTSGQSVQHRVYRLVPARDGLFWHPVVKFDIVGTPPVGIAVWDDTPNKAGRRFTAAWLEWDSTNSVYQARYRHYHIPGPGHHPQPDRYQPAALGGSTLITAYYPGSPPHVSKRPLRVRGYLEAPAAGDNTVGTATISLDVDGTVTNLGTVSGTGPFSLEVPSNVLPGRQMSLRISLSPPSGDDSYPTQLVLPLSIDYVHVARENTPDHVTIEAEVSSDELHKLGGEWFRQGHPLVESLNALVGKTVTLEFATSETIWTTLIEQVEIIQVRGETGSPLSDAYRVKILARRL